MTEHGHSFGKALFGRRWKSIAPMFDWLRRVGRQSLTWGRDSRR